MEHHLVYVNWVVYPTLDLRNSESLADFRSWIQSSQGKHLLQNVIQPRKKKKKNSFFFSRQ
jgi:hypothetical protein